MLGRGHREGPGGAPCRVRPRFHGDHRRSARLRLFSLVPSRRKRRIPHWLQPRGAAAALPPHGLRAREDDSTGRPKRNGAMKRSNLSLSCRGLAVVMIAALAGPALAGQALPFKGSLEGVHVSRTPLAPPRFFDVFEATG